MLPILLLLFFSFFKTDPPPPPCHARELEASCGNGLSDGYVALRQMTVGPGQVQEITYVLGKETEYQFNLCSQQASGPALTLNVLDAYRNVIFTNYDKRTKRHLAKLGFFSQSTGVVHIQLVPEKGMAGCAVFTLGFKPM